MTDFELLLLGNCLTEDEWAGISVIYVPAITPTASSP